MSRRVHGNPDKGYTPIKPSTKPDGYVYVHHFHEPIGTDRHQAQHYIGRTKDVDARVEAERKGGPDAPRIMQVLKERGIGFDVVQVWPGNRYVENALKSYGTARPLCPKCTEKPRVPRVVQKVIRREKRSQQYQARKERIRQAMKGEPTRAEKQRYGAEAGANVVTGHLAKGRSVDQIREIADGMSAGDKPSDYTTGWQRQIDSDLAMARELERQDEEAQARAGDAPPVERYRDQLTALSDREHPSWLPTREELERRPAYAEREAG